MAGLEGARAQGGDAAPVADVPISAPLNDGLVTYEPVLSIDFSNDDVSAAIETSSLLYSLKSEPLDAIGALFERARKDEQRIRRALQALGYFASSVAITIEGGAADDTATEDRLAASPPSRALAVAITITRGPLFKIGAVTLEAADGSSPAALANLTPKAIGLVTGSPARSSDITPANSRIVASLREAGYPLAAIAERKAVADHANATLDLLYRINAGQKATIGAVTVKGSDRVKAPFIAGLAPFNAGDPFRASLLGDYKFELDRLDVFDAITFEEAAALDASGQLPVTLTVSERPRHLIGVSASYSTFDGAALGAYWEHRNLFGEAEHLRIEAQSSRLLSNGTEDYEYALSGTLTLPAFPGARDDVIVKLGAARERPDAYSRDAVELEGKLQRRFDKFFSGDVGIGFTQAREEDALGTRDRTTISLPFGAIYDTRNNPLEAVTGLRATGEATPLVNLSGGGDVAARFLGTLSAYRKLDDDGRTVIAGRVAAGFTLASAVTDLPTDVRFFAGGGGSVRGYPYQHLSPRNAVDQIVGGRSLFESSIEVRHWIWQDIGVAAFVDAGGAFAANFPDLNDVGVGVGLGLRYRTPVGP
ncbi:MAG: autotransporter assembly complex protein TamA, partial [Alphaproteobacteria bacterium]|nr:autotransporter assembly complex protein TamA [Alphaproteobacteria bacterium]